MGGVGGIHSQSADLIRAVIIHIVETYTYSKKKGGGMSGHPDYNGFIPPDKGYYSRISAAETMVGPGGPPSEVGGKM